MRARRSAHAGSHREAAAPSPYLGPTGYGRADARPQLAGAWALRSPMRKLARALAAVASLATATCGREQPPTPQTRLHIERANAAWLNERRTWNPVEEVRNWRGRLETLPGGRVVVRNPERGVWDDSTRWILVPEVTIGSEADGPELFASIADFTVDAAGRMYVLDRRSRRVQVFDADHQFVRTIGREGSGPGEFRDPIGLSWDPQGHLWVVDPANGRIAVFDTAGTPLTTHRRSSTSYSVPWRGGFDPAGRFYEVTVHWDQSNISEIVWFDDSMRIADRRAVARYWPASFDLVSGNSRTRVTVPFSPTQEVWFDPRGYLWSGVTDTYRLYQQSLTGDTLRIVERAYRPVRVSAAEKDEAIRELDWFVKQGGRIDASRIPDVQPAFLTFFVDGAGYLWVQRSAGPAPRDRAIDIFDPEGRYLGELATDLTLLLERPPIVRGDTVYAVVADSLGTYALVRARMLRGRPAR